jgi:hypothetical protein
MTASRDISEAAENTNGISGLLPSTVVELLKVTEDW